MKNVIVALLIVIGTFTHSSIYANDRQATSILLGTAGGALVGQAVGHNAESTIIGAAIGSVLGIVANQPRHSSHNYRTSYNAGIKPHHYRRYEFQNHHRNNRYNSTHVLKKTTVIRSAPYYEKTVYVRSYDTRYHERRPYSQPHQHHQRPRW